MLRAAQERQKAALEAQLAQLKDEMAITQSDGTARAEALERQAENRALAAEERRLADLEAEREKRVAHLQQVAARRVMQMGLARGWSAWLEQYDTHLMHQRMLKQAAARLLRPKLAAAATHWRMEWEAEEKATLARQQELAAAAAARRESELTGEAKGAREELEAALAQSKRELEELRASLHGQFLSKEEEVARLALLKAEEEREKRVEHLQEMAVRRLGRMELARGWGGWLETYLVAARQKRQLAAAVGRLQRPKLAACVSQWRRDWEAEEKAKAERDRELLADAQKRREAALEWELAKVRS